MDKKEVKSQLWTILGFALLIAVFASPFVWVYWFLTDPVNAIANTIGAYLWLIMVIIPGILILVILWGFFSMFTGLFVSIYQLIKALFK